MGSQSDALVFRSTILFPPAAFGRTSTFAISLVITYLLIAWYSNFLKSMRFDVLFGIFRLLVPNRISNYSFHGIRSRLRLYTRYPNADSSCFGIEPQIAAQNNFQQASLERRNPEILAPDVEIASLPWNKSLLRPGKVVELRNATFLKIKSIIKNI